MLYIPYCILVRTSIQFDTRTEYSFVYTSSTRTQYGIYMYRTCRGGVDEIEYMYRVESDLFVAK